MAVGHIVYLLKIQGPVKKKQ